MKIFFGVWKHIASQNLYAFRSIGRNVKYMNLEAHHVQLFESKMIGTINDGMILPIGTAWNRDLDDFLQKFQLIEKYDMLAVEYDVTKNIFFK